ncbi:Uncharacterised protein [Bacillus licheniformis]|nr:Uncharacterised protein [Bacillus licheniformis]
MVSLRRNGDDHCRNYWGDDGSAGKSAEKKLKKRKIGSCSTPIFRFLYIVGTAVLRLAAAIVFNLAATCSVSDKRYICPPLK